MAGSQGAIRVAAPAKINLYLHITGRRDDGYHLIDSLVAFAATHDTLTIEPANALTLAIDGPFAASLDGTRDRDNLILRAARLLAETFRVESGAAITLTKRLPVAAGIGGGSADAAAALKGLAVLWRLDASPDDLARLGATLGADVPVCLFGAPALVSGIGEIIDSAPPLPALYAVLVNPRQPVATASVFAALHGPFIEPAPFAETPGDAASLVRLLAVRRNDLALPAMAVAPVIQNVIAALEGSKGCLLARLSGSGATCFALFGSEDDALAAADRITGSRPYWWVVATRLLAPGEDPESR